MSSGAGWAGGQAGREAVLANTEESHRIAVVSINMSLDPQQRVEEISEHVSDIPFREQGVVGDDDCEVVF